MISMSWPLVSLAAMKQFPSKASKGPNIYGKPKSTLVGQQQSCYTTDRDKQIPIGETPEQRTMGFPTFTFPCSLPQDKPSRTIHATADARQQ